ncbi:MAG: response regulator [Verrucomicrobia bacterium]|nr:response regulator [Verrucomicrobiota bacterium]
MSGEGTFGDRERHPVPLLVLLDLSMPRKNGFEVLEWIRNREEFKELPVLVLTSSAEQPDVIKAFKLGATSCLVKPAEFDDLVLAGRINKPCTCRAVTIHRRLYLRNVQARLNAVRLEPRISDNSSQSRKRAPTPLPPRPGTE